LIFLYIHDIFRNTSVFTSKSKKSDLEKICKENLAYLIDEGYEISVNEIQTGIHPFKSVHYSVQ
jgi:hypothetical protein